MKKSMGFAGLFAFVALALTAPAVAQQGQYTIQVPFNFNVSTRVLPAGEYDVCVVASGAVEIHGMTSSAIFGASRLNQSPREPKNAGCSSSIGTDGNISCPRCGWQASAKATSCLPRVPSGSTRNISRKRKRYCARQNKGAVSYTSGPGAIRAFLLNVRSFCLHRSGFGRPGLVGVPCGCWDFI